MLREAVLVWMLICVAVVHVVLAEGAAIRVPGEVFSDLFPGKSLEGLVLVEGVTGLVLREVVSVLMLGKVVAV